MEGQETKTEATSSTNQKNAKVNIIVNQWELKVKTNLFKARENLSDQVGIGFSFTFNCLRRWCTLYGPITKRCKAKNQSFPGSLSKLNWKLLYLGSLWRWLVGNPTDSFSYSTSKQTQVSELSGCSQYIYIYIYIYMYVYVYVYIYIYIDIYIYMLKHRFSS